MADIVRLEHYQECTALYIFADLRGFTAWSERNQAEVRRLTRMLYSLALAVFEPPARAHPARGLVKFLGDGFFSVHEYDDESDSSFAAALDQTVGRLLDFVPAFYRGLANSNLHDRSDIGISFGLSYGTSFRFHLPGRHVDYVGNKVNLASRLCGGAASSEVAVEYDLRSHIESTAAGQRPGVVYAASELELRGIGSTIVCKITDSSGFCYRPSDLRHIAALVDVIGRAASRAPDHA